MLRSLTLTPGFSAAAPIFAAASSMTLVTSTAGFGAGGVAPWADAHAGTRPTSTTTPRITDRITGSFRGGTPTRSLSGGDYSRVQQSATETRGRLRPGTK